MKKDIEKLRKKMGVDAPGSPKLQPASRQGGRGEPPEKLPITSPALTPQSQTSPSKKLPGAPLPSEPIAPFKPTELTKPPRPVIPSAPSQPKISPSRVDKSKAKKVPTARPRKGQRRKFVALVILAVIILLVGGGFYYWWNYLRVLEKPKPEIPISLIKIEISEIISIKEGEKAKLFEKLKNKAQGFQEQDTFRRILIKKDYFLSFKEISEILGMNIFTEVLNNLKDDYILFFYSQKEGNRLGIIVKVENVEILKANLRNWERTIKGDLRPIFLGQESGEPATEELRDNTYQNINIRYLNFPEPSLTIDYAVAHDYLIITTSKKSMYVTIDRVLENF